MTVNDWLKSILTAWKRGAADYTTPTPFYDKNFRTVRIGLQPRPLWNRALLRSLWRQQSIKCHPIPVSGRHALRSSAGQATASLMKTKPANSERDVIGCMTNINGTRRPKSFTPALLGSGQDLRSWPSIRFASDATAHGQTTSTIVFRWISAARLRKLIREIWKHSANHATTKRKRR